MSDLISIQFPGHEPASARVPRGTLLSEVLSSANSPLLFGCRTGHCGTCLVKANFLGQPEPEKTSDEIDLLAILAPDEPQARLACQLRLEHPCQISPLDQ